MYSENKTIQNALTTIEATRPSDDFHSKALKTGAMLLRLNFLADCDVEELLGFETYASAYEYIEDTLEGMRTHNWTVTEWLTQERHTGQIEGTCDLLVTALTGMEETYDEDQDDA